jgi:transcriptional regulator with XRE-family HTH domain
MTQSELARCVGLTRTSIVNIEQGRQKVMLHTLYAIADVFGVPVANLLPALEESSPETQVAAGTMEQDALAFFERALAPRIERDAPERKPHEAHK